MQSVKSEMNPVQDICNEEQKTMTAMENNLVPFEKTIKTMNRGVTNANVTKKN